MSNKKVENAEVEKETAVEEKTNEVGRFKTVARLKTQTFSNRKDVFYKLAIKLGELDGNVIETDCKLTDIEIAYIKHFFNGEPIPAQVVKLKGKDSGKYYFRLYAELAPSEGKKGDANYIAAYVKQDELNWDSLDFVKRFLGDFFNT